MASAVHARRTLDVIDVSSAINGVSKSDCTLAKNIAKHLGTNHGSLVLASLFLICSPDSAEAAVKGRLELHSPQNHPPSLHSDISLLALHLIRMRKDFTQESGIQQLASALSDVPSVLLLRAFTKDQLIALRDLIGFVSVSGIADDPRACVTSVAEAMKAVTHNEEHDHD